MFKITLYILFLQYIPSFQSPLKPEKHLFHHQDTHELDHFIKNNAVVKKSSYFAFICHVLSGVTQQKLIALKF